VNLIAWIRPLIPIKPSRHFQYQFNKDENQPSIQERRTTMPKYVIEREVPGAGKLSADELKGMAQKSCGVLQEMGPQIQWQESFVTDDKVYCIYIAQNEEAVREHAQKGEFPVNSISEVKSVVDPTTAES
jgi:hypothetical protein